ncbi:MAG: hypothetical protein H6679_01325 [Epsilonproteobacteria bacterium]|nr:hypothetical protein [Campylobacterota bacterium]
MFKTYFSTVILLSLGFIFAHVQCPAEFSNFPEQENIASFVLSRTKIDPITVREGTNICYDEYRSLLNRDEVVRGAIKKLLGRNIRTENVPNIGVVASGGGYRAAIAALGFMRGLEKINMLDTAMHFATLSGSTWMLAAWIAHGFSLQMLKRFLRVQLEHDFRLHNFNFKEIVRNIRRKLSYGQRITIADLYGGMLADTLFETFPHDGQGVYLSSFATKVLEGKYPIPIFTAVMAQTSPYEWCEFTPFEVGSEMLGKKGAWIPTWAFGKKFKYGISTDLAPEQTLGFFMGMFGSAYAASFTEVMRELWNAIQNFLHKHVWTKLFGNEERSLTEVFDKIRLSTPKVFNFTRGMDGILSDKRYLKLVDAGLGFNLPFPPLFRRNINLYLVCDASEETSVYEYHALRGVEDYARRKGYKFPRIDYENINERVVSVFYDRQDPEVPVVVYFPNQVPFSTFKFTYSVEEFNSLYKGMEQAVIDARYVIRDALERSIQALQIQHHPDWKPGSQELIELMEWN